MRAPGDRPPSAQMHCTRSRAPAFPKPDQAFGKGKPRVSNKFEAWEGMDLPVGNAIES